MIKTTLFNHLGFPIRLIDWPHVTVEGEVVQEVNYVKLEELVFQLLPIKGTKLTGAEIRFIRHHLGMTQKQFSGWLVDETDHSTICKWEGADLEPTGMTAAMERSLRLQLIGHTLDKHRKKSVRLNEVMAKLSRGIAETSSAPMELDAARYYPIPDRPVKEDAVL